MEGTLTHVGDRWQLRFERTLPHPPGKVWRALTEAEHLAAWFPSDIEGDREAGAKLRFVFRNGEGPPSDGEMLVYDPPSTIEFRWEEVLRFDLRPKGEGCVLTFVDTFDELGKASRDGAGWHACLDVLADHLDGRPDSPAAEKEHWQALNARYVERFGPEASTIGPARGHGRLTLRQPVTQIGAVGPTCQQFGGGSARFEPLKFLSVHVDHAEWSPLVLAAERGRVAEPVAASWRRSCSSSWPGCPPSPHRRRQLRDRGRSRRSRAVPVRGRH